MIAVVFAINLVHRIHGVASVLPESSRDHLGLDKNVAGRAEHIEFLFFHLYHLVPMGYEARFANSDQG